MNEDDEATVVECQECVHEWTHSFPRSLPERLAEIGVEVDHSTMEVLWGAVLAASKDERHNQMEVDENHPFAAKALKNIKLFRWLAKETNHEMQLNIMQGVETYANWYGIDIDDLDLGLPHWSAANDLVISFDRIDYRALIAAEDEENDKRLTLIVPDQATKRRVLAELQRPGPHEKRVW